MSAMESTFDSQLLDQDARVFDFLNDKIQTFADFETLDSLIERVHAQQALLKKQLKEAEADLVSTRDASEAHRIRIQTKHSNFDQQQKDIDQRLLRLVGSNLIEDAIKRSEPSMEKLRKVDLTHGYLQIISEVEGLSRDANENLQIDPDNALHIYGLLRNLFTSLQALQIPAEGAAPHLLDHVEKTILLLHSCIKDKLTQDFEQLLNKLLWPKAGVAVPDTLLPDWTRAVGRLLELQKPELEIAHIKSGHSTESQDVHILLPLEIMTRPLEQRFNYHFEGNRPTNKLDKPEYFLSHITDLLTSYTSFVNDFIQPALLKQWSRTPLATCPAYIDSTSALITSFLPMIRRKILSLLPQVVAQPQLLSHLMHEVMSFDTTLREEWQYAPTATLPWAGLTNEILEQHSWFDRWLTIERDFALARYQAIIDSEDSGEIDYDTVAPNSTKPTKAAIRVNDLLETITDRYRPLSSFSQKLRFLIDIQISIFDRFHQRLHSGLEAYRSKTSSIGRTMQGVTASELASLQGVQGLDRICRVFGSANYLEKAMRDWSDDIFFIDLWSELQTRALNHDSSRDGNIAGPLSVKEVAERTSAAVGITETEAAETAALFDETAASYRRLRIRSEGVILERLNYELREAIRPYYRMNPWSSLASASAGPGGVDATSADLAGTLNMLSTSFNFLKKALAPLSLRKIARQVAKTVDGYLWDRVLMGHSFSATGAAQLAYDVGAIEGVFEKCVGEYQGKVGLKRIGEGVTLLNLPINIQGSTQADGEDAWENSDTVTEQEGLLSLREVEERVFHDNESAREVLEQLGLELLTETDARHVLERRVELGS